jgi:hypothetical protein
MQDTDTIIKTPKLPSLGGLKVVQEKKARIAQAALVGPLHESAMRRQMAGAMKATEAKRSSVLTIEGMHFVGFETLNLSRDFDRIEIDPRYQRKVVANVVNPFSMALKKGGSSLAPIVLVRRSFKDEYTKPGMLYLLDGQQRVLAHLSAEVDKIQAVIYRSDSIDAEMRAFSILNTTPVKVGGNQIVRAMGGPACDFIRECDEDPEHPFYGRALWAGSGRVSATANIGALMTLKGMAMAVGVVKGSGKGLTPAYLVPKLDANFNRSKADAFLRVLARSVKIEAKYAANFLFVLGLGQVCAERWQDGRIVVPTHAQCSRLARVDWQAVGRGSVSLGMLPVICERIKRTWK